jgi:hypothetical protein
MESFNQLLKLQVADNSSHQLACGADPEWRELEATS